MNNPVIIVDKKSESVPANQTPVKPNPAILGKINVKGIKSITCLNKLKKVANFALPIDWK